MEAPRKKGVTHGTLTSYDLCDGDQLRDGLSNLFEEKSLCDVEIQAGGKVFPAHRVVLAASSTYFEAMLTRGFRETQSGSIKLEDVTSAGLEIALRAIYKGKVDLSEANIYDAVLAAHHLQHQPLLNVCEKYLLDTLNAYNCMNSRNVAFVHDMTSVVDSIDRFILENFRQFCFTESFLQLSKEELCRYLRDDGLFLEETKVFEAVKNWLEHDEKRGEYKDEISSFLRYGLIDRDKMKEVAELFPSLETRVMPLIDCDDEDNDSNETTNPLLLENKPEYRARGCRTYAMLMRKRSDPYVYANGGETDKLAFLREKEVNGKTEFVGWHDTPPVAFLDSSVQSFVFNNYWFLLGIDSDDYSYFFACLNGRNGSSGGQWLVLDLPTTPTAIGTYAFLLNEKICIGGGACITEGTDSKDEKPHIIDAACSFDIRSLQWTDSATDRPRIAYAASCEYKGEGYIIGGYRSREDNEGSDDDFFQVDSPWDQYAIMRTVYVYKPDIDEYVAKAPMNSPRYQASASAIGDRIVVVGGLPSDARNAERACEVYSPQSDQWTYARGDPSIAGALTVPTLTGFAVLKDENYPLHYFDIDSEGKLKTYQKLSEPAVKWMPGKDHWAYIEVKVMTVAVLTMLPNNSTSWKYKVKDTTLTLARRK